MVKHTQTIRQQHPTNCLSVFDYFVGLALKELRECSEALGHHQTSMIELLFAKTINNF